MKEPTYEQLKQRIRLLEKAVSKAKQTEIALQKAQDRLRQQAEKSTAERQRFFDLVETLPVMVCLLTPDYGVVFANRAFRQQFGESDGRRCYEYCCGYDKPCPFCEAFVPLKTGRPHHWEFISPDGNTIIDAYDFPFTDSDGSPLILEMDIDITERRRAEDALCKSEEKYRILFETMIQGVVYQNADGEIISANPAAEHILGLAFDQMQGVTSMGPNWNIIREDGTMLHGCEHPSMISLRTGKNVESFTMGVLNPRKNDRVWISVNAIPLFKQGETIPDQVYTTFEDITEIRKTEQKYRILFQEMQNAFALHEIICDDNGKPVDYRFLEVNPAFEHLTGLKSEKIIGKTAREVLPVIESAMIEIYGKVALTGEPAYFEHYSADLNKYLDISVFQVFSNHFANIFRDVTERKNHEEEIHRLSQMLIQAQENEKYLISCELHDSIAQNLSALKINCDLMKNDPSVSLPELKNKMEFNSNLLAAIISDVRNLSYDLRLPGLDEFGLVKALETYCTEASSKGSTKINFISAGMSEMKLDGNSEIHIYRLVQEGLSNIRKHADAGQASIMLLGSYPYIILRMEDNGKGFDMMQQELLSSKYKKMGIRSMQERVNLLNGQMTIQSQPMKGTRIFIKIPFLRAIVGIDDNNV